MYRRFTCIAFELIMFCWLDEHGFIFRIFQAATKIFALGDGCKELRLNLTGRQVASI